MPHLASLRLLLGLILLLAMQHTAWATQGMVFPVNVAVQTTPPQATFSWSSQPAGTVVKIYRRNLGAVGSGTWVQVGSSTQPVVTYTDSGVSAGGSYEYKVERNTGTAPNYTAFTVVTIDAPLVDNRGAMLLVVDNTITTELAGELTQMEMDLAGDGWEVVRLDFAPHGVGTPEALKAAIKAAVTAKPSINSTLLFGKLPMVRSGMLAPDGHTAGAHETDTFYADLNGTWTDTSVNVPAAGHVENENIPGDGKYDQSYYPSSLELAVGRVTFHDMPSFRKGEIEYLRDYLHKDHTWRMGQRSVQYRGYLSDTNNGYYLFTARNWMSPMFGTAGVTFGPLQPATSLGTYMWAVSCDDLGPICGSAEQAIFMESFKSYKQKWWRTDNAIRGMMTQPDWGLACVWGARPPWYFHHMAAGRTFGYSGLRTQNNGFNGIEYGPPDWGGMDSYVSNNIQGDPTLRMHPVLPPGSALVTRSGATANLTWTASAAPALIGYHVYRSTSRLGSYTRLTASPTAATAYTDTAAPAGTVYYQVRAVATTSVLTGSYFNQSQASFALLKPAGICNRAPVATAASLTVKNNTPTLLSLQGTDADGDALTPIVLTNPQHGQLRWRNGRPFYVSATGYAGSDSVIFAMTDGTTISAPATVDITVDGSGAVLVAWDFVDGSGAVPPGSSFNAANVQPANLVIGAGFGLSNPFPYTDQYLVSGANGAALGLTDWIGWTVTPDAGYRLSLARTTFGLFAPAGCTLNYELRVSTDGFATFATAPVLSVSPLLDKAILTADLSGIPALQNTAAPVEFRLYLWHNLIAGTAVGLGRIKEITGDAIDDLAVFGTATVISGNNPPIITSTKPTSLTVLEDVANAVVLSATDADGDPLTWTVLTQGTKGTMTVTSPGSTSTATYTPNANLNGSDTVVIRVTDGNGGTDTITVNVSITPVNDVPSFTKGANQTVLEDAGSATLAGWATALSAGPADEAGQTLAFLVTNTNNALFSTQPAVAADGTLTYTPAANANGTATVSVSISDNGGTANGGVNTSVALTFTITVTAVNDVPAFTKGADQIVLEDAGARTVAGWATAISKGASNESAQIVSFLLTNTNNALFSVQPAVAANGTLTYTPAANATGSATVSVRISDNGGTANGGVDTSAIQTFTITISPVNDAPSFTKGANQTVLEDAGATTVAAWATAISRGGADEAAQTLAFLVTNTNNALFSVQPAVSPTGTLTFTPAANANGTATVSISLSDNGGVASGGADTSAVQTFTITVTAVNDVPSFTKGANQTVAEDSGARTVAAWATAISKGPADETAQTVTFLVTNTDNTLFSVQPAVAANGTLTFTPATSATGTATVSVRISDNGGTANGGVDTSAVQTFTITITSLNDPPVVTAPIVDQTAVVGSLFTFVVPLATFTDPDADPLTWSATGLPAWLTFTPATRTFTGTPAAGDVGPTTITVAVSDGSLSANDSFVLTVGVLTNVAPTITTPKPGSLTTLEDTANTLVISATDINGDTLSWSVLTQGTKGTATVSSPGGSTTATYTPNANQNGGDSFVIQVSDGNGGTDTITVNVTITAVNDVPAFTKGANQTVLEESGAATVFVWATTISTGPADEAAQTVTFLATNTNNALFSVQPAIAANGTLTFTPAANATGSATVSVSVSDNGGTANGGVDTSAVQTFTITITGVNDAPSFTKGADQTVLEDSGARTVAAWATAISTGPADEAAQTVAFLATNTNNALFSVQPAVAANGTLTFTPAANANGSATVSVRISDNGGTANGGVDTSAIQTFTITVTAINDVPAFTKGANQTVLEDSGATTVAAWATAISKGPADEVTQVVAFLATNTNNALFSVQPAISATGTLTFTVAANTTGSATVSVRISDNGGTANGGVDTSAIQTFTITVTGVNDAPSFTKGADQLVLEDCGARTVAAWATAISKGPADETAQTVAFLATNSNNTLFSVQPAIAANGTLTYTPAANASGSATVSVSISDNGGTANGGVDTSAVQTFTITVLAVNDAPSFTKGANQTVAEDSGARTVAAWATAISVGPADEMAQTRAFVVSNTNNALFSTQPAVSSTGTLTFTPAANASGVATVSVNVTDNGGTANGGIDASAIQTFTITVTAVNDAPIVAVPVSDQLAMTATAFTFVVPAATFSDLDGDPLTWSASGLPAWLTFTPATRTFAGTPAIGDIGTTTVTVSASDGSLSASDSFVLTVILAVNLPPVITTPGPASLTTLEDTANSLVISATDANGDPLTWTVLAAGSKGTMAVTSPGGSTTATYTPNANQSGSDAIVVQVSDGNGGLDTITVNLTITPVNDVPSFLEGANQIVLEDSSAHTVANWATAISKGPANEAAQTLAFLVTNSDNALFSTQPAISATGTLTYTLAANATGTATVSVSLSDNGGTANGGVDTSAIQTFTITITPINDIPSFTKGADQTVAEDSGAATVVGWATAVSKGPADEAAQTLTFLVTNSNNALFSVQPAIAANGTLTYTPAADTTGSATVSVRLSDDGGTVNGGLDTTAVQTFIITVTPANDAPVVVSGIPDQTAAVGFAFNYIVPAATFSDPDADPLTWSASGLPAWLTFTPATRTFNGTPAIGDVGAPSITVTVQDPSLAAASSTFTLTITVDLTPPAPPAVPIVSGTNPARPILSGTTEPGATVRVYDWGLLVGWVIADAAGDWTWTPSGALTAGIHRFTVVVVDIAGNASVTSPAVDVTVPPGGGATTTTGTSDTSIGGCGAGGALSLFLLPMLAWRRRKGYAA